MPEPNAATHLIPRGNDTDLSGLLRRLVSVLYQRYGVILALIAALLYSGQSILMAVSTSTIHPVLLAIMMSLVMTLCSLVMLVFKGNAPPNEMKHYFWLVFGGIAMSAYLTLLSFGILYADVGDAITVTYTSLGLVGIISWVILREPPGLLDITFSLLAFVGVVFIARPSFLFGKVNDNADNKHNTRLLGIAFSFGSAIAIGFAITLMRKHSQIGIHTFVSLFVNGSVILVTNLILAIALKLLRFLSLFECFVSLGAGVCYFLAQLTLYYSLKIETATLVNVLLTAEIFFAFILQFVILGIYPLWTSYVGAFVVILACIGITLKEKLASQVNEI